MDREMMNGDETRVAVPLEVWVREIVKDTVNEVLREALPIHMGQCEAMQLVPTIKKTAEKVENIQLRLATMAGAGLVGGGMVALIQQLLGG